MLLAAAAAAEAVRRAVGPGRAEAEGPGRAAEAARTIHCVRMWIMRARKIQAKA